MTGNEKEKINGKKKAVRTPQELIDAAKKSGMELTSQEQEKLYSLLGGDGDNKGERE